MSSAVATGKQAQSHYEELCVSAQRSANHRDNALAATCRLVMAGAAASVIPREAFLQTLLRSMPFQVHGVCVFVLFVVAAVVHS